MKKFLLMAMTLLMAVGMQAQTYWNGTSNKVFSGSGTQADPYLISTPEQLAGLAERTNVDKEDFAGQYIKLTADIYLTDFTNPDTTTWLQWEPIAHHLMRWGEAPDTAFFRGHFDGDGHTIYNMYYGAGMNWGSDWDPNDFDIDLSTYDFSVMYKALFVHADGATIENVRMANARMAGVNQAFLVVDARAGTVIRNCHVQGEMRGTQSGAAGLVNSNHGLIENCSVDIVTDLQGGGAFVGTNETDGIIRNCTSTGSMRCTMSDGAGFASQNFGLIEKCTADVLVQALYGPSPSINEYGVHPMWYRSGAGFVITNQGGTIRECAAFGDVWSEGMSANYIWTSGIAGFCFRNWGSGRIESCYCTGALRDISDSTGIGGNPTFASFCYDNGYDAAHYNDDIDRGDIINCYSTSTIRHHDAQENSSAIHAFTASYHGYGGFYADMVEPSQMIGCYFNQEGLPAISEPASTVWHGVGKPLAQMQTQAFVDTLNMLASLMGLSQWELRDGLPRPTGVYQTSSTGMFGGGDGSKANPYIIATKQHLENMRWMVNQGFTFKDQYFLQTADIALNAPMSEWEEVAPTRWTPIASPRTNPWYSNTVINEFKGDYNGGFHEIQNMYISNTLNKQGLFYRLGKGAVLRNLGVTDVYLRAATIGILAGEIYDKPRIIQCWTSGDAATQGQYQGDMGGLVCTIGGQAYFLNCSSSARMTGTHSPTLGIWVDAVCGGFPYDDKTLINFLYTGHMNKGGFCSFKYKENFFADREVAQVEHLGDGLEGTAATTEWMQSKELVNIYNYSVARWNEKHAGDDTLQLNYWQWQEGNYPRVAQDPSWRPSVAITFNSNGGAAVTTKYVYPGSEVLPPQRPLRNGYIFAGWYKDAELTQFFDWKTEHPTSNITLYARWLEDKRFDIDITPFQNEFTKTYHIKTAAQLRGFAAMQNGQYSWEDSVYCYDSEKSYAADNLTQTQPPMSFKGKKVVLDNDILLCDTTDWQYWGRGAFGVPFIPIGWYYGVYSEGDHTFAGSFDGQGHTVYGMYIEKNGTPGWDNNVGLFALAADSAVIRNVGVAASVIDGQDYNTLGQSNDATRLWRRCGYSHSGWRAVGMLIGSTTLATIEQCYAEGNIYCTDAKALIGKIDNYWSGHNDTVSNCYSRVNVYDQYGNPEGAFTGSDYYATFINCYNAGMTNSAVCSCPYSGYGSITHVSTYYNKQLIPNRYGCDNSKGCTTNEMHAKATYQDWDFNTIWGRNDAINDGYPYLRVFHSDAPADSPDPIIVTGLSLNMTQASVITGDSLQLIATVFPENAENKKVIWTADTWGLSDALPYDWFVGVDETGLIRTKIDPYCQTERSGRIYINAMTEEGEYKATCILTITQPALKLLTLAYRRVGATEWTWRSATDITFGSEPHYAENFEYMIVAYASPDAAKKEVTWALSDETSLMLTQISDSLCTIPVPYSSINVHCSRAIVRVLQATNSRNYISAQLPNGIAGNLSMYTERIDLSELVVYKAPAVSRIQPDTWMSVGGQQQLDYIMYGAFNNPNGSGNTQQVSYLPTLQWTSSNTNVLTVDQNGLVTAVGAGEATITLTAVGTNVSVTTNMITVEALEPTGIEINEGDRWATLEVSEGETLQLTARVLPEDATDKTVTWSSGNTNIATVDQNGLVTAVQYNTSSVRITATTANGISTYTNVLVTRPEPVSVVINENITQLNVGETYQLTATVLPASADQTVTWSSDNRSVATVNSSGLVRALHEGSVTITAKTRNDWEDFITIEVIQSQTPPDPNGITVRLDPNSASEWEDVYLYAWTGSGETKPCGNWPGTLVGTDNDGWWSYTFDSSVQSINIIWNNGAGAQTVDITGITASTCYSLNSTSGTRISVTVSECSSTPQDTTYYTIQFLDWNGAALQSTRVPEGTMPVYTGATPTRAEDERYTYQFSGWSPTIGPATANANYTAQYTATEKPQLVYYSIQFLNYDGTVLQSTQVLEGETPAYTGATPTKPEDALYTYEFSGWLPAIGPANKDAVYIAQFTQTKKVVYYTVTFLDWDGTELLVEQVEEGHNAVGPATNPTREGYIFSGWSKPITNITANLIVIAQYELAQQPVYYTIRFLNWDGAVLQSSQVLEGERPEYTGETPTKPEDDQYTYTFSGWSPTVVAAAVDADYTAQYTATEKPQPKDYLPYGLQAVVDGTTITFSWSVKDLPTYFGIAIYYNNQEVFSGTTINNNTSLTLSSVFEQYGTYTWKLCSTDETRQPITEWVDGPSFEIRDPKEGIEDVQATESVTKVLIDGQVFILRGDKLYTITGTEVK